MIHAQLIKDFRSWARRVAEIISGAARAHQPHGFEVLQGRL